MTKFQDIFGAHHYCALILDTTLRVTNVALFQSQIKPAVQTIPSDLGQALRDITGLVLPRKEIVRLKVICRRLLDGKPVELAKRSWGWMPGTANPKLAPHKAVAAPLFQELIAPSHILLLVEKIAPTPTDPKDAILKVAPRTREDLLDLARQLAVSLNHEINNPLFVASATLEDVLAEEQDPKMQQRLQTALDAVWRVAESIKLLQNLSEVVSTTYIPGFTMIDLKASSKKLDP